MRGRGKLGRHNFLTADQGTLRPEQPTSLRSSDPTGCPAGRTTLGNDGTRRSGRGGDRRLCGTAGCEKGGHDDGEQHRQPKQDARPRHEPIKRTTTPIGGEFVKRQHREAKADGKICQTCKNNESKHWRQPECYRSRTDRNGKEPLRADGSSGAFRVYPNPHEPVGTRFACANTNPSGMGEVAATKLARSLFTRPAPRLEPSLARRRLMKDESIAPIRRINSLSSDRSIHLFHQESRESRVNALSFYSKDVLTGSERDLSF